VTGLVLVTVREWRRIGREDFEEMWIEGFRAGEHKFERAD
jgi:hypothetical protein